MEYSEGYVYLLVIDKDQNQKITNIAIPMKAIFQVQRGLTSAIQRFHGKNKTQRS